jgi:uncharacterized Zn-finger protein
VVEKSEIDMNVSEGVMEPPEIVEIDPSMDTVACDGGAMGHPVVYLNFDDKDYVDCYYCGRRFVRISPVTKSTRD